MVWAAVVGEVGKARDWDSSSKGGQSWGLGIGGMGIWRSGIGGGMVKGNVTRWYLRACRAQGKGNLGLVGGLFSSGREKSRLLGGPWV